MLEVKVEETICNRNSAGLREAVIFLVVWKVCLLEVSSETEGLGCFEVRKTTYVVWLFTSVLPTKVGVVAVTV
jgi:hypothetical protein